MSKSIARAAFVLVILGGRPLPAGGFATSGRFLVERRAAHNSSPGTAKFFPTSANVGF